MSASARDRGEGGGPRRTYWTIPPSSTGDGRSAAATSAIAAMML
jgi:hypothetical protein